MPAHLPARLGDDNLPSALYICGAKNEAGNCVFVHFLICIYVQHSYYHPDQPDLPQCTARILVELF